MKCKIIYYSNEEVINYSKEYEDPTIKDVVNDIRIIKERYLINHVSFDIIELNNIKPTKYLK